MKNLVLAIAAMVGLASAILASTSIAGATNSWNGYHWARTDNSLFTIQVESDVSGTWAPYLNNAASQWGVSPVLDLNVVDNLTTSSNCSFLSGKVRVCDKKYGFNGWLGVAEIYVSGSHITQGRVRLNDSYFNTSTYNTPGWRAMVVCQESGHTLGLDHQDTNFYNKNLGTCMDYTNNPSRDDGLGNNTAPNQHDYDELAIIYLHPDSFNSYSSAASVPGKGNGSGQAAGDDEGLPPGASPEHGDTYVRDLGNGNKIITHVFWVQPGNPGRP